MQAFKVQRPKNFVNKKTWSMNKNQNNRFKRKLKVNKQKNSVTPTQQEDYISW